MRLRRNRDPDRPSQPGDIPALASVVALSTPRHDGWVERSDAEKAVGETIHKGNGKSSQTLARLCDHGYLESARRPMYRAEFQCFLPTALAYEAVELPWPDWREPAAADR